MVLESFDQDIISLIPDNILMESPLELSQYRIENWKLDYFREDDITAGLKMEVTFKRILTNEILTTYLPSFFLIGIVYCTAFFDQIYFEACVTVNLTVMLVATTLFIR